MSDQVIIHTRWGSYPVHKHWLDSLSDIIARYELNRQKGRWEWDSGEREWYWVEARP